MMFFYIYYYSRCCCCCGDYLPVVVVSDMFDPLFSGLRCPNGYEMRRGLKATSFAGQHRAADAEELFRLLVVETVASLAAKSDFEKFVLQFVAGRFRYHVDEVKSLKAGPLDGGGIDLVGLRRCFDVNVLFGVELDFVRDQLVALERGGLVLGRFTMKELLTSFNDVITDTTYKGMVCDVPGDVVAKVQVCFGLLVFLGRWWAKTLVVLFLAVIPLFICSCACMLVCVCVSLFLCFYPTRKLKRNLGSPSTNRLISSTGWNSWTRNLFPFACELACRVGFDSCAQMWWWWSSWDCSMPLPCRVASAIYLMVLANGATESMFSSTNIKMTKRRNRLSLKKLSGELAAPDLPDYGVLRPVTHRRRTKTGVFPKTGNVFRRRQRRVEGEDGPGGGDP